jgi:hypothetical protein
MCATIISRPEQDNPVLAAGSPVPAQIVRRLSPGCNPVPTIGDSPHLCMATLLCLCGDLLCYLDTDM